MSGHDAAPPWDTRLDAVVWWHRASSGAGEAVPEALRGARSVPLTVGAIVRYRDTPVGPYDELLAVPVLLRAGLRPAGHVPFMAVDSPSSLRVGREHWALPKGPAAFAWSSDGRVTVSHRDWTVDARVRPRFAPVVPVALAARCLQVRPNGAVVAFGIRGAGLAATGRARIAVEGAPPWLLAGDHPAVVLQAARLRVGPSVVVPLPSWGSRTTKLRLRSARRARRQPAARRG
jgi:hypothetical protein